MRSEFTDLPTARYTSGTSRTFLEGSCVSIAQDVVCRIVATSLASLVCESVLRIDKQRTNVSTIGSIGAISSLRTRLLWGYVNIMVRLRHLDGVIDRSL